MADNQITPFQLTDQFKMDNFNQRINETNIALANNDPRKWGLGTTSIRLNETDDLNDILTNGFYTWGISAPKNTPSLEDYGNIRYYCSLFVIDGVQIILSYNNPNTILIRTQSSGVWVPWEWVNPPMLLGVEYRTIERYLGKPVYAMAVDFGNLPNATDKIVELSNVNPDKIVSYSGCLSGGKTIPTLNLGWGGIDSTLKDAVDLNAQATNTALRIYIATKIDRSDMTAVVTVKYTKTTN